ncbi:MAG: XVIPCD domain-containing protein [Lysobacteraceae bacterium]
MAEWFKGVKDFFDRRPEEEKRFDRMLEDYRKGDTPGHRNMAEGIELIMLRSPDLKARTLEAIRDGHVRSYSDTPVQGAGAASYQVSDGSIRVAPRFNHTDREYMETMFMLGHETEHARSLQGVNYGVTRLVPEIERIARSDGPGPRDYTDVVNAFAERTRAEEGRAHIGGFNAIASYVVNDRHPKPEHLLRELYETHPARMGDFIEKTSVGVPATYALKDGLTLGRDGRMPYSPENIEAMKGYYADKAQLGAPHMNYRQDAIQFAAEIIGNTERDLAESRMVNRDYLLDPVRLQAHPALGLPADGRLQAKGEIEVRKLDLGDLGPLVVGKPLVEPSVAASSSAPVSLAPGADDHPLFAQALTRVGELHARDNLGTPQEVRNLAAALAVSAQEHGLHRIDSVSHSMDGKGLIATQGAGDVSVSARVEGLAAIGTPEGQSLGKLAPLEPPPQPSMGQSQVALGPPPDGQGPKSQHM